MVGATGREVREGLGVSIAGLVVRLGDCVVRELDCGVCEGVCEEVRFM